MTTLIMAGLTATGIFIVMAKLGILKLFKVKETRRFADGGLDLLMSFGLIAIFAGTISGMMVAVTSGLVLSGMLFVTRMFVRPTKSLRGKFNGITKRFK